MNIPILRKSLLYSAMVMTLPAGAGDIYWTGLGSDDFWSNGANWSTGSAPYFDDVKINGSSSNVAYDAISDVKSITITGGAQLTPQFSSAFLVTNDTNISGVNSKISWSTGIYTINNYLSVDDDGIYSLSGNGTLNKLPGEEKIGVNGTGTFNQSGTSSHNFSGALYLGDQAGSHGTYNLSDNAKFTGGGMVLGEWGGTGEFNQSGGEVTLENLTLGRQPADSGNGRPAGRGTYSLHAGTLTVTSDSEAIGAEGIGVFNQDGGMHTVGSGTKPQALIIGWWPSGEGTYNLSGTGQLVVNGWEWVGQAGKGSFTQEGNSSHTVTESLTVGGDYTLASGDLSANREYIIGTGSFVQSGGTNTVADHFVLSNALGDNSTYELQDGQLNVLGPVDYIGSSGGTGTFTQSGGIHTAPSVVLGIGLSVGDYNLTGTGRLETDYTEVGLEGEGNFLQTGGTHQVGSNLVIGRNVNSIGGYNLSNGTLITSETHVGAWGTGSFTQDGGNHGTGTLVLGYNTGGQGEYTLNGGALTADWERIGLEGEGTFNQYGGTNTVVGMVVSQEPGSSGTYNLHDGSLYTEYTFIGSEGTLEQYGGEHTSQYAVGVNGSYTLSGGQATVSGNMDDFNGTYVFNGGNFEQKGGTHQSPLLAVGTPFWLGLVTSPSFGGLTTALVADQQPITTGGNYTLSDNGILNTQVTAISYDGLFEQTGGIHRTDSLFIASGLVVLTNQATPVIAVQEPTDLGGGSYTLSGGELNAGQIVNYGTFNYSGGNLATTAGFTNNGEMTLSGSGAREIAGNVDNHGVVKLTDTTVNWTGTFTNYGRYESDPSTNTFNDLVVDATGYLVGGAGDQFLIKGDFMNNSTQNTLWDTEDAYLGFIGAGNHQVLLAGVDLGAVYGGYDDNFAWDVLSLGIDEILNLGDGNTSNGKGGALYVEALLLENDDLSLLSHIFGGTNLNIYYDPNDLRNAYLLGKIYGLKAGGSLIPIGYQPPSGVPEPATLALFGLGLVGLGRFLRRIH